MTCRDSGQEAFVEGKATRQRFKQFFEMSTCEMLTAINKGPAFHVWCVMGLGSLSPTLMRFQWIDRLIDQGDLRFVIAM